MGIAVGIDLGTTFSAIAWINAFHRPEIIKNLEEQPLTPSVVAVCQNPPLVGNTAKELQALGEEGVAAFFKRAMGDLVWRFEAATGAYTPTDLSALVLRKLKHDAEVRLGQPITDAVITVPAYFNNDQREATKAAGEAAGLTVLMTINEPTAAALAFGLGGHAVQGKILVYDLGGGTFDVTLIDITQDNIRVLATDGDHELGGKDWDDRIANYIANEFYEEHAEHPLEDKVSYNDVLVASEQAKINLSTMTSARMRITHAGIRAAYTITRAQFEEMTRDLLERSAMLTESVLEDQRLSWRDLRGVLLVGGSTRMPMVRDFVVQRGGEPLSGVNVDEAVALGAAIQASKMIDERGGKRRFTLSGASRFQDVTSHSLGMIALNEECSAYVNSIILSKNQPIPSQDTRPYKLRTSRRGPNRLEVFITQGESMVPTQCAFIGKYTAEDVPHGPRGEAVLDITYAYDQSGIVQLSARDRTTGQELEMRKGSVPDDMSWVKRPPEKIVEREHLTAYLAFDLSGSMSGDPLIEAQEAAREFVRQMDLANSSLGLISFADSVVTDIEATQNAKSLERAIGKMTIGSVGYGNDASPFAHTHGLLKKAKGLRFIIVLTDGAWSYQDIAIQQARGCHADNIEVIAVGFGSADQNFLNQIATSESGSFFAQAGELVSTFGSIAQQMTESGGGLRKL